MYLKLLVFYVIYEVETNVNPAFIFRCSKYSNPSPTSGLCFLNMWSAMGNWEQLFSFYIVSCIFYSIGLPPYFGKVQPGSWCL